LVNFNTGFSVLNLLTNEDNVENVKRFNKIKEHLRVALMEEEVMYLSCGNKNGDLTGDEVI